MFAEKSSGGETYRNLGREYNVDFKTIAFIIKRVTWPHVDHQIDHQTGDIERQLAA